VKAESREPIPIYGMEVQVRNAQGNLADLLMSVDYITLQGEVVRPGKFYR
jgi:hypothetical protein